MLAGDFMDQKYYLGTTQKNEIAIFSTEKHLFFDDKKITEEVFCKQNISSYEIVYEMMQTDENGENRKLFTVSVVFQDGKRCLVDLYEDSYKEFLIMMY